MPGRGFSAGTQYRYGFNGQEKSDELGEGLTTAQFWEYDSRIGRRWNVDPKPTIGISSYSVLEGNPILQVDLLGDKPRLKEAAAMAAHVYGDKKDDILKGDWKVTTKDFGIQLNNPANGLKSQIYQRTTNDGKTEYVYATAGTEAEWADVGADVHQPFGLSSQYTQSVNNAKIISDVLAKTNSELTFTGHSLGGGEAAANAYATGRDAITFNAAGLSKISLFRYGVTGKSRIDAFIAVFDPLNGVQNRVPLMPDVDGKRHYLLPHSWASIYNGHSMNNILQSLSIDPNKYALPEPPPPLAVPKPYDPNEIHSFSDFKRELSRWFHW